MAGINRNLTREELYGRVWSAPSVQVAKELGISDVALAKRCKKHNIPKPSVGYWAKVAAGQKPPKKKLPPPPNEVILQVLRRPVGRSLPLPDESATLHPLAEELRRILNSTKKDSQGRIRAHEPAVPEVEVSKEYVECAVTAFHVIVTEAERRGVPFRKSHSKYESGYFERERDRIHLKIEEELIAPAGSNSRTSYYSHHYPHKDKRTLSGYLTFSLRTGGRYDLSELKRWKVGNNTSIEKVLPKILREIFRHYIGVRELRVKEAIEREARRIEYEQRQREYEKEEAIRREK